MGITSQVRVHGEIRAFRDEEWLRLHEAGRPTAELAEESGVSVQLLRRALSRARKERESRIRDNHDASVVSVDGEADADPASSGPQRPWWLELVPMFPVGSFTPASECPHKGPIQEGSLLCCMVCSASGMDGHPALTRDPATDPRPEPKSPRPRRAGSTTPDAVLLNSSSTAAGSETRRQRRSRVFRPPTP